ncbi:MAG: Gfo/Idh/MocA family oxidoreductase [Clostridiales bacterium]|nr:Gfo/Idh/MocA family oxidoreductase [Clostridiales bacterium]
MIMIKSPSDLKNKLNVLNVCVVGMGPIGNLHADIYKELEKDGSPGPVKLSGVCDLIREKAEASGKRLNVPWFTNTAVMLKTILPDICSIATGGYEYGSDHYEPAMQALSAGCHVLCEKPISNEIIKGEEMVEMARLKKRYFGVNLNHRFTPAAQLAKKWQDEGRLGDLLFINMSLWIGRFQEFDSPYFHLKALNPHSVDIMRYFCGDVSKVYCFAMKAPGRTIWSTASINMQFKSGAVGHLTSSYDIGRGHPMERCEVAGTKGRLVIDDIWREVTLYPAGDLVKSVHTNPVFGGFQGFDDTFRERIRAFIAQVASGNSYPDLVDGSGVQGLAAQKVIQAAIDSLNSGKVVEL